MVFFSLNELETEASAIKKELKDVEKVSKLVNSFINIDDSIKTWPYVVKSKPNQWLAKSEVITGLLDTQTDENRFNVLCVVFVL